MTGRILIAGLILFLAVPITNSAATAFIVNSLKSLITGRQKSVERIQIPVGKTNRATISVTKESVDGHLSPGVLGPEWSLTACWDKNRKTFVLGVKRSF